ncbi:uncharacterized protein LOC122078342 [Macadamia integrifolia]|uniref:uncharacterized protein LOC122078342 n=1 Tax=Macadamia integrifolia TaxID=60698 RepID=UPI001C4F3C58|nr:uncharacterized protein LOC122078342 [Macadamia integrifolia]
MDGLLVPDLVVEPMPSSSFSQTTRPSPPSSASPATEQARSRNAGSTIRTSGASTTPSTNAGSLLWDRKTIQFSINAWVFIIALLAIFPLTPRNISSKAYRLSYKGTACSSLYSLYSLYGKPRLWNLQALNVWFHSVITTKDFMCFLYCLVFATSQLHLKFALIPVLCRALEHVAKFLRRNFGCSSLYRKYLEVPCLWVESNTTTLNILTANAEIALGLLIIFSILSRPRNILQLFMHWQFLKLKYIIPGTASYHQSAWAKIGRTVDPLINQYAPFLSMPLSAAKRWWFW